MNPLDIVSKSGYFHTQGTPHQNYREPRDIEPGSKIVCSKSLVGTYAHIWTLKGSRVFHKVTVCEYGTGTLRVDGVIRPSFITDNFDHFKTKVLPQCGQFQASFFSGQINSGVPKPVKEIQGKAEALLNVICKVEGLKTGSFQFMLDQFISQKGESEDVTAAVVEQKV